MLAFILRRLLWAIPVLFFVALVSFFLMHQAPGGPFDKDNNRKQVDGATLKALNTRFGLDKPQYVNPGAVGEQWQQGQRNPLTLGRAYLDSQFGNYLLNALHGDLGPSYRQRGKSVQDILLKQWPFSMRLGLFALAFAVIVGIPLGIVAALKQNSWIDYTQPVFRNDRGRGAIIRHRLAGDHHLRHHAAMDLDLEQQLEQLDALHRAKPGAGHGHLVIHDADHPHHYTRDQAPGLYSHGARQGAGRAHGDHASFGAQWLDTSCHAARPSTD